MIISQHPSSYSWELNNHLQFIVCSGTATQYKSVWLSNPWTHPNTIAASSPYTFNSETLQDG